MRRIERRGIERRGEGGGEMREEEGWESVRGVEGEGELANTVVDTRSAESGQGSGPEHDGGLGRSRADPVLSTLRNLPPTSCVLLPLSFTTPPLTSRGAIVRQSTFRVHLRRRRPRQSNPPRPPKPNGTTHQCRSKLHPFRLRTRLLPPPPRLHLFPGCRLPTRWPRGVRPQRARDRLEHP